MKQHLAGRLCLFLLLALILPPAQALEAKQHLNFKIVIPTILLLKSATVPQSITITDEDISRGYVDVAAEYVVASNSRKGFTFTASLANTQAFVAVQAMNYNTNIATTFSLLLFAIGAPNMHLPITLTYRLWLNQAEARSGRYSWPIVVVLAQN